MHSKEVGYLHGDHGRASSGSTRRSPRRAGLFHDIGKAVDYEREGTHPEIGAEVATRCGENWEVINAVAAHHEDIEVTTPITILVATADALSGARPGARRKSAAEYIRRIEQLEGLANGMEGVEQSYALQAGREIRVIANTGARATTRGSTCWPPTSPAGSRPRWTTREDQGDRHPRDPGAGSRAVVPGAVPSLSAGDGRRDGGVPYAHPRSLASVRARRARARAGRRGRRRAVSGFSAFVHTLLVRSRWASLALRARADRGERDRRAARARERRAARRVRRRRTRCGRGGRAVTSIPAARCSTRAERERALRRSRGVRREPSIFTTTPTTRGSARTPGRARSRSR